MDKIQSISFVMKSPDCSASCFSLTFVFTALLSDFFFCLLQYGIDAMEVNGFTPIINWRS
ncbi:hypothetical protein EJD97_012832 [Solanum chilense]|uniref:Uncharacterized protein n=1 Tax=Solanum chilense TaxID=4083 RepID=A0A6N2AH21_SOLCI|nr:hypothetical protein EJD97_012832 [Solanum chilense]